MASTRRTRLTTYTVARHLPSITFARIFFMIWLAAVFALLLLVSDAFGSEVSLAARQQILFFGLLIVEVAAVYQIYTYKHHR